MRFLLFLLIPVICPISALSQIGAAKYHNRDAWRMESRELRVTVMQVGGHIAEIVLRGKEEINPLWLPELPTLDPTDYIPEKHEKYFGGGSAAKLMSGLLGHNLCFPYWGDP